MIINERITTYLHSLGKDRGELLEGLRSYAAKADVPIIRRETESLLLTVAKMISAEKVLEIGTGIAFSSILMAKEVAGIQQIITIENYLPRILLAKENIRKFEKEKEYGATISLIEADAAAAVKEMKGPFDLVFLDGPKAQYIRMLPDILRLLRPGGVLIADNVLQEGDLINSRYITTRRDRTIHDRMRDFIWTITHSNELETTVIPLGDGVSISILLSEPETGKDHHGNIREQS